MDDKALKILFTSHRFSPDIGGIESISALLAINFVAAGHTVKLVTMTLDNSPHDSHKFPFLIYRKPDLSTLISCYRWADVVFQNNIEIRQLWPLLLFRKPLVIGLQTWIRRVDGKRDLVAQLKLAVLRIADRVIACSEAIRLDSIPSAIVIGNPYRSSLFVGYPDLTRRKSIVFLGRLVSDKGLDLLIKAFAKLRPPQWRLMIIGSGPELASSAMLAKRLGIANSVDFVGPLQGSELVRELNQQEIIVVPSRWEEPFGVVVLEGLACGCVVLASDGGGLPDAVGSAGLLFRRGDQSDLTNKLSQLIEMSQLREDLRRRARYHLSHFHEDIVAERYLDILKSARRKT